MNSERDLANRIRLGEDSKLELKLVMLSGNRPIAPKRNDLADELGAMANSSGGTIVLGVGDDKNVSGIPIAALDSVEKWVMEICNDSLKLPLEADIHKTELPNIAGQYVPVILIDVPRSLYVHKSPGGYFKRIGSSKREISPEVLARLFQERSQTRVIRFDESIVPRTTLEDLDDTLSRRFLSRRLLMDDTDSRDLALQKLRIVADDDDGETRATVAGVLMCTRKPRRWMPHAYIQAVSYTGNRQDVNYQTDARDLDGPLDEQVFDGLHFLRRNMFVHAKKDTARRDRPQFSERAVFEALVNAVAHRDYSMGGARIRFHLFRDRIELYVPGGLANTLTTDSMDMRQYSRNELVVSLLARCSARRAGGLGRTHLMDRRGDGVPIILDESREASGRYPEYTVIDESELQLIIWAAQA